MNISIKSLFIGIVSSISLLTIVGCGGGSGSATGPASGGFSGSTITINPTITFTDATNCTYTNTDVGSPFPAAGTPAAGTYTYAPSADYKSGVLTLVLGAPVNSTVVFNLNGFAQNSGNVTGFRANYNGRSFPVTVSGGTILAQVVNNGGGGLGAGETAATAIPASMQGTYNLVFFEYGAGSNIADGTATTFTITANTLVFGSKTLRNPVFRNGHDLEWIFKDGALEYAASIAADNSLNEINVGSTGGSTFYGQYRETSSPIMTSNGQPVSGTTLTATVTSAGEPTGYPAAGDKLTAGQTLNFTFGSNSITVAGIATDVPFVHTTEFGDAVYVQDLGNGESNQFSVGVRTAGSNTYVTYVTITYARIGDAPYNTVINASYFAEISSTSTAP